MNDRRTKAEIIAAHDDLLQKWRDAATNLRKLEDEAAAAQPARVPAADALAGCIRALDPLVKSKQWPSYGGSASDSELSNVIRHLIGRYNIDVTERVTAACDRPHLDDATEQQLISTLKYGAPTSEHF